MSEHETFIDRHEEDLSTPRSPSRNVRSSALGLYGAIAIEFLAIAFLSVVVFVHIYITCPGLLSTRIHALYVTGSTIAATAIASYASGQVCVL